MNKDTTRRAFLRGTAAAGLLAARTAGALRGADEPAKDKPAKPDKPKPPVAPPKVKPPKTNATPPQKPTVTALNALAGKVVLVNAGLRFVVVDFSVGRKPVPGQRLGIYRKEQKIGEVKISGQSRDVNFAADLVTGEVRVGDEIRED